MASPDLSVFGKIQTVSDFDRLRQEFEMKKQLQAAQIKQANKFDIDQVGQQAFVKAANGMELSPTEQASLQYLDSKQQTMSFNPVTGAMEQKPSLLQRAGIGQQPQAMQPAPNPQSNFAKAMRGAPSVGTGDPIADMAPAFYPNTQQGALDEFTRNNPMPSTTPQNEWDMEFQAQMAAAEGNPKLQQELRATYAKSKMEMNADQSKNAGFADRMAASNPLIEKYTPAGLNNADVRIDRNLPDFIANRVVSKDYQSFNQAQRDFINAQLRRESGAVISDSEFDNAAKQYFPQVGDSPQVLLQKKANREAAFSAMQRSAGPAYKTPPAPVLPNTPIKGDVLPGADGDYLYLGGDPAQKSSYKKVK